MSNKVSCYESDENITVRVYDPNGNKMTMGEIVCRLNDMAEELLELRKQKMAETAEALKEAWEEQRGSE